MFAESSAISPPTDVIESSEESKLGGQLLYGSRKVAVWIITFIASLFDKLCISGIGRVPSSHSPTGFALRSDHNHILRNKKRRTTSVAGFFRDGKRGV